MERDRYTDDERQRDKRRVTEIPTKGDKETDGKMSQREIDGERKRDRRRATERQT